MKLIFHAAYFLLGGETLLKHKEVKGFTLDFTLSVLASLFVTLD